MLNSTLQSLNSVLTGGGPSTTSPASSAQPSPAPEPVSAPENTSGVIFDLSEASLKAVEAAQAENQAGAPVQTEPEKVAPFMPAAMTIAAEIAALQAANMAASGQSSGGSSTGEQPESTGATSSSARIELQVDPDEEARARALAIQAQDRDKLLSLAERLAESKADIRIPLDSAAKPLAEPEPVASL